MVVFREEGAPVEGRGGRWSSGGALRLALPRERPSAEVSIEEAVIEAQVWLGALALAHEAGVSLDPVGRGAAWRAHLELAEVAVGDAPIARDLAAVASVVVERLVGRPLRVVELDRVAGVLAEARPDCPRVAGALLADALSPSPSERWRSADAFSAALSSLANEEPGPRAAPSSLPPMSPELLRRITRGSGIRRKPTRSEAPPASPTSYAVTTTKSA